MLLILSNVWRPRDFETGAYTNTDVALSIVL
jgi:hypothetical protein